MTEEDVNWPSQHAREEAAAEITELLLIIEETAKRWQKNRRFGCSRDAVIAFIRAAIDDRISREDQLEAQHREMNEQHSRHLAAAKERRAAPNGSPIRHPPHALWQV